MIWRKDRQEGTETHFISRSMASTTIWNWSLGKAFSVDHFISNRGVRSKAQLQRETTKNIWVSSLNKVLASQAKNRFRFAVTIEKVSLRAAWALVSPPKTVFYFRIQQLLSSAKYFFLLISQEFEIIFADFSHCRLKLKVTECTKRPWLEIEKRWFTSHSLWSTSILCRISLYLL